MNCPNCGGPLNVAGPGSYLYCQYCSSLFFPEQSLGHIDLLGVATDLHCPVCKEALQAAEVAGYAAQACKRCGGLLINQGSFATVVQYLRSGDDETTQAPRPLNQDDLHRLLHCPSCSQLMETHPYYGPGNIVIDVCMNCRLVWLDRGELDSIVNAPRWQHVGDEGD